MNGGAGRRRIYRNGYYERDFVTGFGTIRLRIAHPREELFAGGIAGFHPGIGCVALQESRHRQS